MEIKNRKSSYNYSIIESYTAGIALNGCEVKSIRNGNANINEAFCLIENGNMVLKNAYIKEYITNDHNGYQTTRDRQLLLNKKEINKILKQVQLPGYTIIPLKIYFNEKNIAKLLIGICKGKHDYDKREDIKKKDLERELNRKL